jgi:hypothetical protein
MATTITGSGVNNIVDGTITNADINASAAIAGSKVDGSFGKVLQVVSTTKSDTTTYGASGDDTVTIMSTAITPSSTTSKILIFTSLNVSYTSHNWEWRFWFDRDGTAVGVGDADGSRPRATFGVPAVRDDYMPAPISFTYMDTPSTNTSTTYSLKFRKWTNQIRINQAHTDADSTEYSPRLISTLTLMEVSS